MQYPGKESSILEFKREVPQKKQILLKTVIGFSNIYGGQIIIGVDDDGEVIGVPEESVEQLQDDLYRSIYDVVAPSIFPSIVTKRMGDSLVIIIDITEGIKKPYHFHSKRISEGTYVRLGAHTVLATPDIIHQLQWQSQRKFLDEMPVYGASEKDIDKKAFKVFLEKRKQGHSKIDVDDLLFHYEILVKEQGRVYPSVGGVLLFGKNPSQFFSESFVICSHVEGTTGRDVIATRDAVGSLFQQYKDSIAFITSRLNTSFTITGTGAREEKLEIPPEAIREIVLNAIVHRNYQLNSPSKITIYDDRVEIFSPGNFPGPLVADKVNMGVTYIRNKVITRIFREVGLIERLGSGFITLFESYAEQKLPTPVILEGAGFIKCILPRKPSRISPVGDMYSDKIASLLSMKDAIKLRDVMAYLKLSRASAGRLLTTLVKGGHLQRIGKGRATHYKKL